VEPNEPLSVGDVAKTETTRQTIILVFGVLGTVTTIYVARKMQDADAMSTFRMWTALTVKRWADKQADRFSRLAAHMATVYNGEKL
jgi:hypothetical protein